MNQSMLEMEKRLSEQAEQRSIRIEESIDNITNELKTIRSTG